MKIDEAAFGLAFANMSDVSRYSAREIVSRYLAAIPSAEPGRDRIAVVVSADGCAEAMVLGNRDEICQDLWYALDPAPHGVATARAIVCCNLPRPAEPVEVEGSVEGVGP